MAILLDTQATLIDEILDLHDRMVGSAVRQSQARLRSLVSGVGKAVNERWALRPSRPSADQRIKAKEAGIDPFAAIEKIVSWECFIQSVGEAEKLARSEILGA